VNQQGPAASDPSAEPSSATIAFVDIVKFTSLTAVHGDFAAADAATALESIASARSGDGVRLVKSIGDGVLLCATGPVAGLGCVALIVEDVHDFGLDVRAGLDHGPVVARNDDVFGSTVNRASRLAAIAEPGTIAMSRPVAQAAADLGLAVAPRKSALVKGFQSPIEVFELDPCEHGSGWLIDPVCGMRLASAEAFVLDGVTKPGLGFCSRNCALVYSESPERFAQR